MSTDNKARADDLQLVRPELVRLVRSTPDRGTCLLTAEAGYGRRTLFGQATEGHAVTLVLPQEEVGASQARQALVDVLDLSGMHRQPQEAMAACPQGWLLVLNVDPVLHAALVTDLVRLVHDCPPGHRVGISTSGDLSSAFTRERLTGLLVELDQEDLAFTDEESRDLLARSAPALGEEVAARVVQLCDGWPSALAAASRYTVARPDADLLTWLRTHGAELLMGPWLEAQSQPVRDMLLDTAILDRLHPGLVESVTDGGSGELLARLSRPRGPLRRSGQREDDAWFTRHPLLTALLRYSAVGRAGAQERHRRAASWYRAHGLLSEELLQLILAGDAEVAADRFHMHESELMATGRVEITQRWYESLPSGRQGPPHLLREAWAYALSGRLQEATVALDQVRSVHRDHPAAAVSPHPAVADLEAEADVLEAWLAERTGDLARTLSAAQRARRKFGTAWSRNSHQLAPLLEARAALLVGDLQAAGAVLDAIGDNPFAAAALGEGRRCETKAADAWIRGHVYEAHTWASRYDRWRLSQDPAQQATQFPPSIIGSLCLAETGDPSSALHRLSEAQTVAADPRGSVTDQVLALLATAHVLGVQWHIGHALERVTDARATVLAHSPKGGLLPLVAEMEVRLRLASGDRLRAERLIRALPFGISRQLLRARLSLQRGLPTAAALVREIEPATPRQEVEQAVLAAWAQAGRSRQRAEQLLLHAADIAGEHGMRTALILEPEPLLDLAGTAARHYVHDRLLELVEVAETARSRHLALRGQESRVEQPLAATLALTRGELQILLLLPSRATYGRIAEELAVSVNTVKTRLRRLYAKLGVHDRDGAVAVAGQLGLITGHQER